MCGSVFKKALDPGTFGIGKTKSAEARQTRTQQAQAGADSKRTKLRKTAEQKSTRSKQIEKFNSNVATGGAKRAANVGR